MPQKPESSVRNYKSSIFLSFYVVGLIIFLIIMVEIIRGSKPTCDLKFEKGQIVTTVMGNNKGMVLGMFGCSYRIRLENGNSSLFREFELNKE